MATESADEPDESEVSVRLPPDLEEWLDERAAVLDVDPGELLVQLASAYRAAADLGDESLAGLAGDGVDPEAIEDVREQLAADDDALHELNGRMNDVEARLEENVEDLRKRVLQLRDAVGDTASQTHSHREFAQIDARLDDLSETVESVATDLDAQGSRVADVESRLDDADEKLTRVARAVVSLRREADQTDEGTGLEELRLAANRSGVTEAACGACGGAVTIGLLSEPSCPHCGSEFAEIELPAGGLGRTLGFRRPELRCAEPPALEAGDD
ncbi:hypothetical protein HWV07_18680 [Natronomonas salina]|uniref:hypothetical protein n=1 Tax=Natronomonas salina TaxID=1710540 RepID=UPI0015B70E2D|nr:hypothetical protein [Natronomonas salina]QLD90961.1 hypothetical protein HWV07_18680 [Natronomonas salina]